MLGSLGSSSFLAVTEGEGLRQLMEHARPRVRTVKVKILRRIIVVKIRRKRVDGWAGRGKCLKGDKYLRTRGYVYS